MAGLASGSQNNPSGTNYTAAEMQAILGNSGTGNTQADPLAAGNMGPSWGPNQTFNQAINIALEQNGIDPSSLSEQQQSQLQTLIWGSPYLTNLMTSQGQSAALVGSSAYLGTFGATTALSSLISTTLFDITKSSDPAAAAFGTNLQAEKSGTPLPIQTQEEEELLAMGLPADLYSQYSNVVSIWQQYYGGPPSPQQLAQLLGVNVSPQGQQGPNLGNLQQQALYGKGGPYAGLTPPASAKTPTGGQGGQGYSGSGQMTYAQLEGLIVQAWSKVAGNRPMPNVNGQPLYAVLAAIAYPESGATPATIQQGQPYGTTGWGLWQITPGNSEPQYGTDNALLNPLNNAMAAVSKYLSQGLDAWTTYTGGEYQQYMKQGVIPDTSTSVNLSGGTPSLEDQLSSMGMSPSQISLPNPGSIDLQQITDEIRANPSHLIGLNMGQYTDLRSAADSYSQKLLGHDSTDGIVAQLFAQGDTSPSAIQLWYDTESQNALGQIPAPAYRSIAQANQGVMQNVYNEPGFDPQVALQQYSSYYAANPPGEAPGKVPTTASNAPKGSEAQTGRRPGEGAS